jgi:hypothetical protein
MPGAALAQPVLGILHPTLAPFHRGAAHPPPFWVPEAVRSLFWGFSFHPAAAILQAGCFPQPPGFSNGWHAWSCVHAAGFITAVHLFPCYQADTHPAKSSCMHLLPRAVVTSIMHTSLVATTLPLFCEPGCNQVIWSHPSSEHIDATRLCGCIHLVLF